LAQWTKAGKIRAIRCGTGPYLCSSRPRLRHRSLLPSDFYLCGPIPGTTTSANNQDQTTTTNGGERNKCASICVASERCSNVPDSLRCDEWHLSIERGSALDSKQHCTRALWVSFLLRPLHCTYPHSLTEAYTYSPFVLAIDIRTVC
jgi:hypothetical protein